jgi:4'-phosphopantetheinyl transferase EntD
MGQLLPHPVACDEAHMDRLGVVLAPQEREYVQRASAGRSREFATARDCARRALAGLGLSPGPIPRAPGGEPVWPPGIVGSITHCAGYRAAAVARSERIRSVGIDAEPNAPLPAPVRNLVCAEDEIAVLPRSSTDCYDRVVFSAKESIYKAWYPVTSQWLGFEDVRVEIHPGTGRFTADFRPGRAEPAVWRFPRRLTGRFVVRDGLILTSVTLHAEKGA